MTRDDNISTLLIQGVLINIFSIILAIVVTNLTKKYRVDNKPILLSDKKIRLSAHRHQAVGLLFLITVQDLIIGTAGYFSKELIYKRLSIAFICLFIDMISVLISLTFMMGNIRLKLFVVLRRIPALVRITTVIILIIIGNLINRANIILYLDHKTHAANLFIRHKDYL